MSDKTSYKYKYMYETYKDDLLYDKYCKHTRYMYYEAYLSSPEWINKSKAIKYASGFLKDGKFYFKCEHCGFTSEDMRLFSAHHEYYIFPLEAQQDGIICVCKRCHEVIHQNVEAPSVYNLIKVHKEDYEIWT